MDGKTCKQCGETKPDTGEYFHHREGRVSSDGKCRECHKAMCAERYLTHRDEHRAKGRAWAQEHRDKTLAYNRQWHSDHREMANERSRRWYADHKEYSGAKSREWREGHQEYLREYESRRDKVARRGRVRELWVIFHDRKLAAKRAYEAAHPELVRLWKRVASHVRRARIRQADGTHNAKDVQAQFNRQHGKCYWCHKKTGKQYHVDHVMPLALGGSNGPENLVIACPSCNLSKGARHPMDFAGVLL
jgi:5-methylcytosine-specific restriction endonuclease McrA